VILGLNVFHADASACLVRDGAIVSAVAEERLGARHKHFAGFPTEAVKFVLRDAGLTIADVDHLAIGHDKRANRAQKARYALTRPLSTARAAVTYLARQRQIESLRDRVAQECGFDPADCRFETHEIEHHLAHIASSFYCSGFEEAAALSYDASGDFVSTMFAHCTPNGIEILDRIFLPDSLGYFYTAICQFIGFDEFGEEYKVMGLAAYGKPVYLDLMRDIVSAEACGRFRVNQTYFSGLLQKSHEELTDANGRLIIPPLYSDALVERLGPARTRGGELTQRDRDLSASCQQHFEDVVLHSLGWLSSRVQTPNLVTAGGCALNGVCNARILRETPFTNAYIQCAAGDDGTAVGAALYVWNELLKQPRSPAIWQAALGPTHSTDVIEAAARTTGLAVTRHETGDLLREVAGLLADGRVVGWYQGRSEWGPRALGHRSILAHPGWPGMKDIINAKIKRRESFRPFAPSILAERVTDYFEQDIRSPFMMHVVRIRPERRPELSAVTHEDGTGRLQTVARDQDPLYYDLIAAFAERTGTPVLLNTSFNENEPIVDTPEQAVSCFMRNDIDALCMGPFLIAK